MQTVIQVSLSGHSTAFQLDEAAYKTLQSYLEQARARLKRDPDHEEILRDLEQSIGEKLANLLRAENRVISRKEVDAVLAQVGAVEAGNGDATAGAAPFERPRRLCRIEEGKWFFGVCQGLAAYSGIAVEGVRAIFVIVSVFTGGVPVLIYLVLMFALPVVRTYDDYNASLRTHPGAI
jgi:phage shock protein PspC (stress-responsive transcriptional regulator)